MSSKQLTEQGISPILFDLGYGSGREVGLLEMELAMVGGKTRRAKGVASAWRIGTATCMRHT
jgi:hypothetical protein